MRLEALTWAILILGWYQESLVGKTVGKAANVYV